MASPDPAAHLYPVAAELPLSRYLAQMWARRDFVVAMPFEELRVSHQNTLLGNIWHLGNPLLSVGVYYLIFGVVLQVTRGVDNYIAWLTIGVFAFGLTSRTVLGGAAAISSNRGLMRSIRFPRALLPVSVVISRLLTFGFELTVVVAVILVTGEGVSLRWLALPLVLAVHSALNLGGAFIAARLNDTFRDVQQIIPFMFRLLTYMSGVIFPVERFLDLGNETIGWIIANNPLAAILDMYRWVFMGLPLEPGKVLLTTGVALVLLTVGFVFFRGAEWRYGRA
ncbi:MAG: ABC transporter permease [Acidimicrobiia bacterium]|nr:ABC transporter permease [Acidimicrobiia bacterium]